MGTLLAFPMILPKRRDPHFPELSQAVSDFVRQLTRFQKLADESFQKLAQLPLSATLDGLEMALAGIDAIGRLLPPGEFKTQFDMDRSSLSKQLDLVKGKIADLRKQTDLTDILSIE